MIPTKQAAADFLAERRIAVAGVSRSAGGEHAANGVYTRLRDRGYEVFAVNPNAEEVEGDPAYPNVSAIPDGVDAVVIATTPAVADEVMQDCIDTGISRVWLHRAIGAGSVSATATDLGREHGITVIDGGCPLMFGDASDFGHKVMRAILTITGVVPRQVE